jgi:hypothetical protein
MASLMVWLNLLSQSLKLANVSQWNFDGTLVGIY